MGKPELMRYRIVIEEDMHLTTRTPRLQFTESSYIIRTVKSWNQLPPEIRETESICRFKKAVKTWIRDRREKEPD